MLDIQNETPRPIREVPARWEKLTGHRPNAATVWRWHQKGRSGVRLETFVAGGRRYSTDEAILRFIRATTEAGLIFTREPAVDDRAEREATELGL